MEDHDFSDKNVKQKHPEDLRTMLLHPFLALALSHIARSTSKHVGHAVGDAFDSLVLGGVRYSEMKQNPEKVADEIISAARERGIPIKDEDKEKIITAIQKASKIVDKLTGDVSEDGLDVLYQALAEKTDDPLYVLKRNGIDIEPELEEFRQFLAEISGKKAEKKPKFPAVKGAVEPKEETPNSIRLEAQKLLGILNGLKYGGYSEEAVQSAVDDMLKRAEELAEKGELEVLALYLWTAHLLREGRFEDAEKFLKKES